MQESIFMDKLPEKDFGIGEGWEQTELSFLWAKGDLIGLRDKRGEILVKWKNTDTQTQSNLAKLIKAGKNAAGGSSGGPWRVRWFRTCNDIRYAREVLDDVQYKAFAKAKWQNRKLMRHGFQTGNPWTA